VYRHYFGIKRVRKLNNEKSVKKEYQIIKILLFVVSLCALILGLPLLLSVHLREFIIVSVESFIVHRSLNHGHWHTQLADYAIMFLITGILFFYICLGKTLQKIADLLQKVYLKTRKLSIPQSIWLFVSLCFLFFYVRLNINIMPVIACWIIYRIGFINWLFRIFGKKETKTALFIAGIAMLFFIIVMFLFRVAIVMDSFFGADQNRVLRDFTRVSANHYRVKAHPLYVLLWQSLYHLFCPLVVKTSLAIRIMICIFSGLNCGIFSLFISRITKSRLLNVIICAIMIFSFPQILHGSQILEAYIFTQSSILLMLLYFSFAFSSKKYSLPALLALLLFVTGNNIAYPCIFAIFYIILLYKASESWRIAWKNILRFSFWYIIIFNILLLTQTLFYGQSAPSNIFSIIKNIIDEEGRYIVTHSITYTQYAKDFFNIILFQHLPFNIGAVLNHGWVWALLLLTPFFGFRKITNKPLFIAIIASCVFLFLFHRFYGYYELPLYSPVITCVYVSLFAFIVQVLPKKMTVFLCCPLLAIMIYINSIGFYTVHSINRFLFGSVDIYEQYEYETNINKVNEHIKEYKGNRIFIYRMFNNE